MAFIAPRSFAQPTVPDVEFWPDKDYPLNGGLDLSVLEFNLPENKTNKALNVWSVDGELDKRWGQDYLNEDETPEAIAHSIYKFTYKDDFIKHTGTKLYSQDPTDGTLTEIYSGLDDDISRIFKYNENIYIKQVGSYIQWDGTTASDVEAYIPTIIINRLPAGGGDLNEGYNRLGKGFINSFTSDGVSTVYVLTDDDLDVTTVTITVDGVDKIEGADFTVNRTTGTVTFGSAPSAGTNNVIITAYKTEQDDIDSILNCLAVKPFGGQNDNRLFFGNNGTGYYYWTGISANGVDPTYFPYDNYNVVGLTDENITGFVSHQNTLLVVKERSVIAVEYTFDGTEGVFNSYPVSDVFGSDCPFTLRTVNNNATWLSTEFGVCIVLSTSVGNQRNVFTMSRNIDLRLLAEDNLKQASAIDFDGKYWLCVNDKVYLWDYFISPYYDTGNPDDNASRLSWWYFDNINAQSFATDGRVLYYIDRDTGKTVKFNVENDSNQYFDFGEGYEAVYRYPYRLIGGGVYEFTILTGNVGVRGDRKTSYTVTYFTNDDLSGEEEFEPIEVGSFNWSTFNWSTFTWGVMGPLYIWPLRPSLKNIQYFAVEFSNNEAGKSLNISFLKWQYVIKKQIK